MNNDDLVEEKDPVVLRIAYTVMFYVVLRLLDIAIAVIAVVQGVYVLTGHSPQADLARFAGALSRYVGQVAAYMTWTTDQKPYPFAEWPRKPVAHAGETEQ
jgi:hypothetical protein